MQTGHRNTVVGIYSADRQMRRTRYLIGLFVLTVMIMIFLSFRSTEFGFLSPAKTVVNLYLAIKLKLAEIFHWSIYNERLELITSHETYYETLTRVQDVFLALALGACMSVAGAVFQSVFRNPIAVPSMLGISSGISLSNMLLVLMFSTAAVYMTTMRFLLGYAFSIVILLLVLICGKLMSKDGQLNVTDILLVGALLSRMITRAVSLIEAYYMSEDDYEILQEMSMYGTGMGNTKGWIFLGAAIIVALVPILLMRNSLNIVTFSDEESRVMGLHPGLVRVLSLIFCTILVIAAQVNAGDVGMMALIIPHLCRYLFGSNTRELIYGSAILGGGMMLICRFLSCAFAFNTYLSVISVGTIINFVTMPTMMLVMFSRRRGWN